jgi:photosystem II stability/assembly factor-like uncharacterized protein
MAQQRAGTPSGDQLLESAGCCGVIARLMGAGILVVALVALGLLLITRPPDRWQGIADPSAHPLALVVDPHHPRMIYVGTEQGYILVSRDGGKSWQEKHQGLPATTPISSLALLPSSNQILAGTSKGAYRSLDRGNTWQSAGPGIPSPNIVDAVSVLPDGTLLAGTASNSAYVLPVGATTWVPAASGLPPQSDIYAFLPLPQRGHVLAALISGGIYASQDDGMTWAESDRGLSGASDVNVFSFLTVPGPQGADASILAGTSRGMYVSRDQGATWAPSSAGIGTTRVISLARDPMTPTDVFAGADTGVYQSRDGGAMWHAVGFGLPAEQHVGALGVVHPAGADQVILASVDRLYRYPGQWLLAPEPWRALGFIALALLALALIAFVIWQARSIMAT